MKGIALLLNVAPSTTFREIKRKSGPDGYIGLYAHK
ncbi:IS30 family transposase [Flammeovirga kamogawensis]|nr:IS30 family transposase [Flammeovirga kamogawensis]